MERRPRLLLPLLTALPLVALAAEPALWLARTWHDPAWENDGWLAAALALGLALASMRSGPAAAKGGLDRGALLLLAGAAAARLVGRVLAIHLVGAAALVLDVAALARLAGLPSRPRPASPVALAALFAFSLPLEGAAQRLFGFPLQLLAARLAELTLSPFVTGLVRDGTLLSRPGVALAVDLPCSGARGLTLGLALVAALLVTRRAGALGTVALAGLALAGATLGNAARIVLLFLGALAELPISEEPLHSLFGLAGLLLGALPLVLAARALPAREAFVRAPAELPVLARWAAPALASAALLALFAVPERPLDVQGHVAPAGLPARLGAFRSEALQLSEAEERQLQRWGGQVEKRAYDDGLGAPIVALVSRTRAPVRHLHGPERCLAAAGHRVERLGVLPGAVPVTLWRSTAPDGRVYRVETSLVSDRGEAASSIPEAIFRWARAPGATWTQVQRLTPWEACEARPDRCADFGGALLGQLAPVAS